VSICAACIDRAVELLATTPADEQPLHPATEDFFAQFAAFREQLETDHVSEERNRAFEAALERLESALLAVRELVQTRRG
jgi:hypothetical protein